ncbi:MAG: cell division protein FtsZ [Muribaculaceae bacterium]|nr:cell division protein FtsZ [Muribaculaceae bacterium]
MTNEDIANGHQFVINEPQSEHRVIIKVVGVGGGGNNAINHMYRKNVKDVSFVVCNTDQQALDNSPVPTRVLLGPQTTKGLGAGNVPERARKAAEESEAEINALFDDDTQMVFITAGMGGGTGTGAAPVVARIAKERGLLTVGIITIPFLFEGKPKIKKALAGADEMSKHVDALLVINNERLTEVYKDLDFINAFRKADDTLSTAALSISEIITSVGVINRDFCDVDTTLRGGGAAIISTGYGEGETRVTKAIADALNSPLLRNRNIYGSKRLLFNLYFSENAENKFHMSEAAELTEFISNLGEEIDVIWGVAIDNTLGDKIKMTILASGFDVSLQEETSTFIKPKGAAKTADIFTVETNKVDKSNTDQRLQEEYGVKFTEMQNSKDRARFVILRPDQMDDDSVVEVLEKTPALNRDKKIVEELKAEVKPEEPQPMAESHAQDEELLSSDKVITWD